MDRFRPPMDIRRVYDRFHAPITALDCGAMCSPHNPNGKPFCCDICSAVPAAYKSEWAYLQANTGLWHVYRGDECAGEPADPDGLLAETPDTMLLLACQGPAHCQRAFRALSCRQFPFFPYITVDYRFIGLAYEWEFEQTCWVISSLGQVSAAYREEFVRSFDSLFDLWPDEIESYAVHSEQMRAVFARRGRRIPLLHRRGGAYLLSPGSERSERLRRVAPERLPRFGPYRGSLPPSSSALSMEE
jgi:hypothetical protein